MRSVCRNEVGVEVKDEGAGIRSAVALVRSTRAVGELDRGTEEEKNEDDAIPGGREGETCGWEEEEEEVAGE